jgi:hypothetical protein
LTIIKAAQPLNERGCTQEGRVETSAIGIDTRDSTCRYKAKSSLFKHTKDEAVQLINQSLKHIKMQWHQPLMEGSTGMGIRTSICIVHQYQATITAVQSDQSVTTKPVCPAAPIQM